MSKWANVRRLIIWGRGAAGCSVVVAVAGCVYFGERWVNTYRGGFCFTVAARLRTETVDEGVARDQIWAHGLGLGEGGSIGEGGR